MGLDRFRGKAVSKRTMMKILGVGVTSIVCQNPLDLFAKPPKPLSKKRKIKSKTDLKSPIQRDLGDIAPKTFSGDQFDKAHQILWNKSAYLTQNKKTIPAPTEQANVVIVGGGISGLTSAYLLRDQKPILLERASRFGGNAKGESWQGLDYSIGAAYIIKPEEGSLIDQFLDEIGVKAIARVRASEDPVVVNGKKHFHFWEGESVESAKSKAQFKKFFEYLNHMNEEKNGLVFPNIPYEDEAKDKAYTDELDQISLYEHVQKIMGEELHPHLESAIEFFCWSAFAAPMREISAAFGLNFYASEMNPLMLAPGGNAGIADEIYDRLTESLSEQHLRTNAIVFDVKVEQDGVIVAYENEAGEIKSIKAKTAILSCPKFVVNKILQDIEPEREQAIKQMKYHAYLVANILVNQKVKDDFYGLFLIGDGQKPDVDPRVTYQRTGSSDISYGNFAQVDDQRSIITLYRSLPFVGGRAELFSPDAYEKAKKAFEKEIYEEVLGLLNIDAKNIVDIRITRWGHPIPIAQTGLLRSGVIEKIRKPFKNRVFFVEQDNWALPAFETAVLEAFKWTAELRKVLG